MAHEHGHPRLSDGRAPQAPPLEADARWKSLDEPSGIWDRRENVDRLLRGFYATCALVVLLDIVVRRSIHHPWESLIGFHAWYGFAACWTLVIVAKRMRTLLMRPEDYYESERPAAGDADRGLGGASRGDGRVD